MDLLILENCTAGKPHGAVTYHRHIQAPGTEMGSSVALVGAEGKSMSDTEHRQPSIGGI